ncbi:E3 ubiquitin-protein ligase [Tetrabaena socialis]|uniref:E3 ubiquitin-protein ligase n=1 Tax=Tetrabaena socialis TaxID=47790 RepID=A0A2J7ZYA2_9CHLO|nr:E3 ubiquitin-protein ligase [Tetrabaena socialis]|eukprot:PNH05251.1 E3 ubiquitin-protein ligase [Tetrabaena socialis]
MPYSGGSTPLQPPPLLSADPAAAAAAAAEALCCPICCDLLLGPVVTPCGHAFCQDCFEAWCAHAAARWQARGGLHCPVCRAQLPRALTFCGGPGSRPPLSPCTVLADSVALLCPGRLAQRTAQRATEQAAAAAAAAVAVAPGPPAIGGGNGGGGGGIGRLLLAWVARQRRRLAATLLRRVPAPEVALGAALLGMYSAAFIVITISSLLDLFSASARLRRLLTHLQQLERRGAAGGGGGGGAAWEDSWRRLAAVQLELVRQLASFLSGQEQVPMVDQSVRAARGQASGHARGIEL